MSTQPIPPQYPPPPGWPPPPPPPSGELSYPLRLEGALDANPSRWLWLVKWFLLIPHFVVLVFLSMAMFLLTIVAWFAILFTGHYPRSIFDFNVAVMRWWWRVGYYGYSALGTDKYPPFSFSAEAYPAATLKVPYPEHLSRPGARQVAPRHPALRDPRPAAGRHRGRDPGQCHLQRSVHRSDHGDGDHRRFRTALHQAISRRDLRSRHGVEPLGVSSVRLRVPHARRVPALPSRPGWGRAAAIRRFAVAGSPPPLGQPSASGI